MKVVFLEEVEGTARTGDVKNVKAGFARNYLLPRRLAAPATDHYITIANAKATKENRKQVKLDEDAQRQLPQVDGQSLTLEVRVGEQEKMFGSVTSREIAEQLSTATKIDFEHRQIDLKQPIRALGTYTVPVKLTRNVIANVTVNVIPIGGAVATEEAAEEPVAEDETEELSADTPEAEAPEAEATPAETADVEEAAPDAASEESAEEPTANESEEGS